MVKVPARPFPCSWTGWWGTCENLKPQGHFPKNIFVEILNLSYQQAFLMNIFTRPGPESDEKDGSIVQDAPGAVTPPLWHLQQDMPGPLMWFQEPFLSLKLMDYVILQRSRISLQGSVSGLKPVSEISHRGCHSGRSKAPRERPWTLGSHQSPKKSFSRDDYRRSIFSPI